LIDYQDLSSLCYQLFLASDILRGMSLAPGSKLGPYEIVAALGSRGMGEVYRARDPRLGREVALKILPAGSAGDPERSRRFEQEARATAAFNHPNIMAVFDIVSQDNAPYIVSELLEGETLRSRLVGRPLPVGKAVDYALQAFSIATSNIDHDRARFLPDGKSVVFAGTEPGNKSRIYVQAINSGSPRPISPEGVNGLSGGCDACGLGERPPRVVQENRPPDPAGVSVQHLVFTPDGKYYAYAYVNVLGELYLVEGLR
jgi:Protein kinase domain